MKVHFFSSYRNIKSEFLRHQCGFDLASFQMNCNNILKTNRFHEIPAGALERSRVPSAHWHVWDARESQNGLSANGVRGVKPGYPIFVFFSKTVRSRGIILAALNQEEFLWHLQEKKSDKTLHKNSGSHRCRRSENSCHKSRQLCNLLPKKISAPYIERFSQKIYRRAQQIDT